MQISTEVNEILNAAYQDARINRHEYLTPEHILYTSLFFSYPRQVFSLCGAVIKSMKASLKSYLEREVPRSESGEPKQTLGFQHVMERTFIHANRADKQEIETGDIIISLYEEAGSYGAQILREQGIERVDLLEVIAHAFDRGSQDLGEIEPNDGRDFDDDSGEDEGLFSGSGDGDSEDEPIFEFDDDDAGISDESDETAQRTRSKNRRQKQKTIERYAVDLVEKAKNGALEPLIGRDDILERTMQVLCRRFKNNPVHVGPPGVGKTAITEGLALAIAQNRVPDLLKDYQIWALDLGALVAGTRYRGDFEQRVKQVLKTIEKRTNTILFIDELHMLVGTGATGSGAMDASNLLKPALASGNIRVIGATTPEEYRKFIEKDHALARRFQAIDVNEPSQAEAVEILKGLRPKYEEFHRVVYEDSAIEAAVALSAQFINERFLPDKAIDVIDEAGALVNLLTFRKAETETESDGSASDSEPVRISTDRIETVVASIAKIPQKTVTVSEKERLKTLEDRLFERVFGQDEAVRGVVDSVKRSRAGFKKGTKPVASFLFVGPTGVGKTELARSLAQELGIELIRFDMSEYQERHAVSRLIGSPPGYVGFEEGGLLTEAIRKVPHSVLLLDEVEKAHSDIYNVLLQIMDYATLTDNAGRKADFRNVVIIMTSNAGAREIGKPIIGFGGQTVGTPALTDAVNRVFSPEFRNRLSRVVQFGYLNEDIILRIVRKEIGEFGAQLREKDVELEIDEEVVTFLADQINSREYGAREIERLVEDQVKSLFIDALLYGTLQSGGRARLKKSGESIVMITGADE